MCQPNGSPSSGVGTNSSADATATTKSILKKDEHGYAVYDKDKSTAQEEMAKTWCCGLLNVKPPKSGRDLGVWEKSLEDQSNWISWMLLSYLNPMLKLGSSRVLDGDDIGVPSEQDRAQAAYESVKVCWEAQIVKTHAANAKQMAAFQVKLDACTTDEQRTELEAKKPEPKDPSLGLALFQGFGLWKLAGGMFMYLISSLLTFLPVLILEDLVRYFQSDGTHETYIHPWGEVVGLAAVPFFVSLLQTRYQVLVAHAGVFVRAAVSLLLYHKALKVSAAGRAKTSTGQVVNIMSNDSQQLQRLLLFAGMGVVAPIQIVLSLSLIYRQVSICVSFCAATVGSSSIINLTANYKHSGWTRYVGRCGIHAVPSAPQWCCLWHDWEAATKSAQVF